MHFNLLQAWRRRAPGEQGSVAIIFALVAVLLIGLTFGVLDVTRASNARRALHDALDAATLAAVRSGATKDADLESSGKKYLAADASIPGLRSITSNFKFAGAEAVAKASGYVDPILLGIFLNGPMRVEVETRVVRDMTLSTEVALVLDTTASMSGAKIDALKVAAKDLVQKVMKGADGKVKVAVVPFANYVNIGVSRRNLPWADVPADYTTSSPGGVCTDNTKTTCSIPAKSYACTVYKDGVANPNGTCWTAAQGCTTVKTGTQTCTKPSTKTYKFYGCVGSPAYPKNVRDDDASRRYPGFLNVTCTNEFTPLTNSESAVVNATQSLTATGDTYIPAGLAWGFNMLSPATPMTEAQPYDSTGANQRPRKALVLMTDGANSMALKAADGSHYSIGGAAPTQANQYTKELCDNIKAAKIEIFSVAFTITDPAVKSLLKACASDAAHYYDAADPAALSSAFQGIADSLQQMHISH
jgi:Flp pilus assembly protein TadG